MTPAQSKLLAFLRERAAVSDVSPSFSEMMKALGLKSKSGVARLVDALARDGLIDRAPYAIRSIRLLDKIDSVKDYSRGYERGYAHGYAACRAELTAQRSAAA